MVGKTFRLRENFFRLGGKHYMLGRQRKPNIIKYITINYKILGARPFPFKLRVCIAGGDRMLMGMQDFDFDQI